MKRTCKALCAFLAVVMLCALLPASAWAVLTKPDPPLLAWVTQDSNHHVFCFVREGTTDLVYSDGVPGELVDITASDGSVTTIFVRNTIDDQYLYINEIWAKRIRNTPQNGTIEINASGWYSMNCFVSEAIAERPDVTVQFDYVDYESQRPMSLVIPAGTNVEAKMDGKEVIEFSALAKKLGA